MGGGQSVEDVSNNDDDDSIIKISEAVAKRLLGKDDDKGQPSLNVSKPLYQTRPVSFEANSLYLSKKEQIKVFENYYKQQLQSLEEQNKILKETSQAQFQNAVKEIHEKFPQPLRKEPLCKELQNVIIQCYKNNKESPLKCSHEVQSFIDCVHKQSQKPKVSA